MEKDFNKRLEQLHAYDPAMGEPATAEMAEAYAAIPNDAALGERHRAELAFDAAFRDKLREIPVPPGLAAQIKQKARGQAVEGEREPHVPDSHRTPGWWLHVGLLSSIAATLAVLTIAFTFFINPFEARATPELTAMVEGVQASVDEPNGMYFSSEYEELVAYLSDSTVPIPASLPPGISPESGFACRRVTVNGAAVGVLCFQRADTTFHLFTFGRGNIPRQEDVLQPIISDFGERRCATWTDRENIYVLATSAPRKTLLSVL